MDKYAPFQQQQHKQQPLQQEQQEQQDPSHSPQPLNAASQQHQNKQQQQPQYHPSNRRLPLSTLLDVSWQMCHAWNTHGMATRAVLVVTRLHYMLSYLTHATELCLTTNMCDRKTHD